MPKQFMSLLSGGCRGIVAGVFRAGTRASCGRFLATAMPMGTELPGGIEISQRTLDQRLADTYLRTSPVPRLLARVPLF